MAWPASQLSLVLPQCVRKHFLLLSCLSQQKITLKLPVSSGHDERGFSCLKALSHEAIFSCNLQRSGVSSCLLQEKSPPVTLLDCKIIRLQLIQQLAYVYNSTGACNIFFTQICVASCKKKLPRVTAPLSESKLIYVVQCQNTVFPISHASL